MQRGDSRDWMWSQAMDMLARADRLHRQVFQPLPARAPAPCWEPPIDVLETDREILVLAALPGVRPDEVEAIIQDGVLIIRGRRTLPDELKTAVIHRMELPQGRFERRVPLPPGHYGSVSRKVINGCLVVSLRKVARTRRVAP